MYWVAKALCPAYANPQTSELLQKKTTSTLCLRLLNVLNAARLRRLFEFLLLAQAIKTNVGCASTSSKCTYVLNANSKGPGETAHLRKCPESSELLLLAHAIKTNVDCVSTSTEWMWVVGLWRDRLFSVGYIFLYWPRSCLSITPESMVAGICNIKDNSERVQSKHASRKGSCEIAHMPVQ